MKPSIINLQIPKLILNKLVRQEFSEANENYLFIYFSINDIENQEEAISIVKKELRKENDNELINFFDFEQNTEIGEKKWTIIDEINVYQNSDCNDNNRLVDNNDKLFERVYWGAVKL